MNRRVFLGGLSAFACATAAASAAPHLPRGRVGLGSWEACTSVPTPRRNVGVAVVRNRFYVLGGTSPLGGALNEVYDPAADVWFQRAPLPRELSHIGTAGLEETLYAVGGFAADDQPVRDAFEYNPFADQWRPIAPLPTPRGALALAAFDGRLYAIGGRGPNGPVGNLDRYDPKLNAWDSLATLPHARSFLQAVVFNRRLHVLGGRSAASPKIVDRHDVYDVGADDWGRAAQLSSPRADAALTVYKGRLHVIGGRSADGIVALNEAYEPRGDTWVTLAALPHPRCATGAATIGAAIYVPAGESGLSPAWASDINEAFTL